MEDYVGNRLNSRIPYKLKVSLKGRNLKEKTYYTSDISARGIFVPSDFAPPLDLKLDLKIYLPGQKKPLKLSGKVLRVKWAGNFERVEGFAVEFKDVIRETEDKLLNFLNKLIKGEV